MYFMIMFFVLGVIGAIVGYINREDGKGNIALSVSSTVTSIVFFVVVLSLLIGVGCCTNEFINKKSELYAFSYNINVYLESIGWTMDCLVKEAYTNKANNNLGIVVENTRQSTNNSIVTKEYRDYIAEYNKMYYYLKVNKESWMTGQYIWAVFPKDIKPYQIDVIGK